MAMASAAIMRLFLSVLLMLSRIECIQGFAASTKIKGLRLSSRPNGSAPSHRMRDRCKKCGLAKVEAGADEGERTRNDDRRSFLSKLLLATSPLAFGSPLRPAQSANALPLFGGSDRRQLELCLATILRTQYWAMNTASSLKSKLLSPTVSESGDSAYATMSEAERKTLENARKQPYLEARLGAKALLTQKIGGGANGRVRDLGTFQLKECLADANYWCGELARSNGLPSQRTGDASAKQAKRMCSNDLGAAADDLLESLASIVEFDGLETTIDPSPRSSLMLGMYTPQKGTFVYRTLVERVVPSCERYSKLFGSERMGVVEEFVRRDYADEIPFEVLEKLYAKQQQ